MERRRWWFSASYARRCARWSALSWIGALVSVLTTTPAWAGNDEGILVGAQAAVTGGAVTAIIGDGTAAWYNPAGLARITRHAFDVNASAYGMSLIHVTKLFTLPDGTTSDARVIDWQLIPTALSYSRVLSRRVVGSFGIFIPTTTDMDLRASLAQRDGTRWTLGIDQFRNEYDYIASVGIRLSETLRVGAALHGIYISSEDMVQVGVGTAGATDQPFLSASSHETVGDYAVRLGLGVQWTPVPQLELGLSVQTPALTGFRRTNLDGVNTGFVADTKSGTFSSEHEAGLTTPWELSTPLVVRLGAAWQAGRAQLLLDGTLSSPLNASDPSLDRRLNGNVRVGVLTKQSQALTWGVGVFSDRNGLREIGANYLGVAGGVRIASHHLLSDGQRPLTFGTTLAGRYAYGFGSTEGISFVGDTDSKPANVQFRAHELAFNLGGSVTF